MKFKIIQSIPDIWAMSSSVKFGIICHLYYGFWANIYWLSKLNVKICMSHSLDVL
jgi:hypothetical protein